MSNKYLTIFIISAFIHLGMKAQSTDTNNVSIPDNYFGMSIEDLANIQVSVTGKNKKSLRETPGIVTVITSDEIETMGARDLVDDLRTVPGLDFTGEVENNLVVGVRGNSASEGKFLLLMDGIQINEIGYGTAVLGNRFLLDNIKKVEIIRGPGSAIYGGMAELAVINIITKSGEDLNGGYVSASVGNSNELISRSNAQFGYGRKLGNGLDISLTGAYAEANRSNESIDYATNYYDVNNGAPSTFNYADSSRIKTANLNLGIKFKDLELKALY